MTCFAVSVSTPTGSNLEHRKRGTGLISTWLYLGVLDSKAKDFGDEDDQDAYITNSDF